MQEKIMDRYMEMELIIYKENQNKLKILKSLRFF